MEGQRSQAEQVETIAQRLDDSDPEAAALVRNLFIALGTRTASSEAVGMLRERYGLSAERAFKLMVRVASQTEAKVQVVAERVRSGEDIHGFAADDYAAG